MMIWHKGDRIGRLVLIEPFRRDKYGRVLWCCRCDCGKVINHVRPGHSESCGCIAKELVAARCTKHGMRYSPEYNAWHAMISRCYRRKDKSYKNYGGRGIKVYSEWRRSFKSFFDHVGRRPSEDHSLDRFPDNNGDYKPGNVRWATLIEQSSNKRTNHTVVVGTRRLTLAQWSRESGVSEAAMRYRIKKLGWDPIRAVTTPARAYRRA